MWRRWASVANTPGKRLLMVTLWRTVCRARPATKPTNPERAPLDRPNSNWGVLTLRETILTIRPNLRAIIGSTGLRIISIGPIIIESSAACQSAGVHWRKSPGGGPSALLTRMSGAGPAGRPASRPPGGGVVGRGGITPEGRGDVGNHILHCMACLRGNLLRRQRQRLPCAGSDADLDAFACKLLCAGATHALAAPEHQCCFAGDS